jgi:hypothetical protein
MRSWGLHHHRVLEEEKHILVAVLIRPLHHLAETLLSFKI